MQAAAAAAVVCALCGRGLMLERDNTLPRGVEAQLASVGAEPPRDPRGSGSLGQGRFSVDGTRKGLPLVWQQVGFSDLQLHSGGCCCLGLWGWGSGLSQGWVETLLQ